MEGFGSNLRVVKAGTRKEIGKGADGGFDL
jgi:hypothetical protein